MGTASPTAGKNEPARPPSDQPIPPNQAGAQARDIASTTDVRTKSGEIPLVTVDKPVKALANPNDTLFPQQWAFTKVPYVSAWTTDNTQGAGVTVAVVDTGVQQSHPDLAGQVLDRHYYLHDNGGNKAFEGAGSTSDPSSHGTHVAGTVAALSNNSSGVSGAAPGVEILPVQVLCGDGGGFSSDVADGITWAVDNGAKVINLSLGGGPSGPELSAIQYADANNVVVVAAGGNDGAGGPASYPAAYSRSQGNLIAVAATTNANPSGHPAYGTTGNYLDISAPGGCGSPCGGGSANDVLSTVPGGYGTKAGTSMATPHVSAAAALLIAGSRLFTWLSPQLKATAVNIGAANTFGAGPCRPERGRQDLTRVQVCP